MKKRNIFIIILIVIAAVIGVVVYINSAGQHTVKNKSYSGCLFDSSGQVLDEQVSLTMNGKVTENSLFTGDLEMQFNDNSQTYKDLQLALQESENHSYLMAGFSSFVYEKEEMKYANIGVICMDSQEPSVIMIGFSNEFCKEYNMEAGTIMVVGTNNELQAKDLLDKSKKIDVKYN